MNMAMVVDFYWSFRSPYCYLAMARVKRLRENYDAEFRMRVVYPLAVRYPNFFVDAPPQRISYPKLDRIRVAQHLNIPFADPTPIRWSSARTGGLSPINPISNV